MQRQRSCKTTRGGREGDRSALARPEFIFVNWREMLNQVPLTVPQRRTYGEGIEACLQYCRDNGISVGVATTQIYTHVMQRPGLGVRSPLDSY